MSTEKRVNPTVWAGLMGIGIASAPSCAYAATTAAAPFNPVSALAVGAVVGLLVTIGALVAHTSTAKRRRRAGRLCILAVFLVTAYLRGFYSRSEPSPRILCRIPVEGCGGNSRKGPVVGTFGKVAYTEHDR